MRARLHLVEQPYVLDRDHCLVGEGRFVSACRSGRPDVLKIRHLGDGVNGGLSQQKYP
jgi:hypothetical protein